MSKYLGKLYPVRPYEKFEVICLDCLDSEKYPDMNKSIIDECSQYLCQYKNGRIRHIRGDITYYNNSSWYMGEADNVFDFIADMRQALKNTRKEQ